MSSSSEFNDFLKSTFMVAGIVLATLVELCIFAFAYFFDGQMTFIIQNGTKADIASAKFVAADFIGDIGRLKPGETRTLKFICKRECSPSIDIVFAPDRIVKIKDLVYLDSVATRCELLVLEDKLEIRRESKFDKVLEADNPHRGVGVYSYSDGTYHFDKNRY